MSVKLSRITTDKNVITEYVEKSYEGTIQNFPQEISEADS